MLLKLGVDISRLKSPIRKKLNIIDSICILLGGSEAILTSTYEGSHSPSSLHHADLAIDVRRYSEKISERIIEKLKTDLGPNYDAVFESDHIHIEYDPKT